MIFVNLVSSNFPTRRTFGSAEVNRERLEMVRCVAIGTPIVVSRTRRCLGADGWPLQVRRGTGSQLGTYQVSFCMLVNQ